jgi:hypothetical protein
MSSEERQFQRELSGRCIRPSESTMLPYQPHGAARQPHLVQLNDMLVERFETFASEVLMHPVCELVSRQCPIRLDDCPLAVQPVRLDGVEPRVFHRQSADQDTDPAGAFHRLIMPPDPRLHRLADVPSGVVPHRKFFDVHAAPARPSQALDRIGQPYRVEETITGALPDDRRGERQHDQCRSPRRRRNERFDHRPQLIGDTGDAIPPQQPTGSFVRLSQPLFPAIRRGGSFRERTGGSRLTDYRCVPHRWRSAVR